MKLALASGGKWFCMTFIFAVSFLGLAFAENENKNDSGIEPSFEQFLLVCGCIALVVGVTRFFFVWEEIEDLRAGKELRESKPEQ